MRYSRITRLPSTTPQPAAFSAGSICSARVSASFTSSLPYLPLSTVGSASWVHAHRCADSATGGGTPRQTQCTAYPAPRLCLAAIQFCAMPPEDFAYSHSLFLIQLLLRAFDLLHALLGYRQILRHGAAQLLNSLAHLLPHLVMRLIGALLAIDIVPLQLLFGLRGAEQIRRQL